MSKLKVFISSPYTIGDQDENVKVQMDVFNKLYSIGFIPFAPLLFHFQHNIHPLDYDEWLEIDFAWLDTCDFILRLPGDSIGADKEVKYAKDTGIPTVFTVDELIKLSKQIS